MSADFSPYVNLRVYDKDAGELYLGALDLLQMNVPQLVVRPGTIEDALVQAFSYISTVAVNHINALPNKLMEGITSFMGVPRREGTYASVSATFTALDYDGGTLESGTTLEHTFQIGGQTYREYYELIESVTIAPITPDPLAVPPTPLPSVTATIYAIEQGARQPVASGTELTIINVQPTTDSAIAGNNFIQGSVEESDEEYLARAATFLRSLSSTLATAAQVEAFIVSAFPFVDRVKAYDLTDSETNRDEGAPNAVGYVSVFVYGKDRFLSIQERNQVYEITSGKMLAGLQLVVQDMQILDVTVIAEAKINPTSDLYSVDSVLRRQIMNYLSPARFPYIEPALRKSAIIAEMNKVPGVAYVSDLTFTCDISTTSGDDLLFSEKGSLPYLAAADLDLTVGYV
ncbi:MAG: hypothetical protein EBW15_06915 [Actinobacteria bacterium]|nr:hypothetical protein [Actinomycetota bacterium]